MPGTKITLACQDYDHTRALADGAVPVAGFDVKVVTISPPSQIFLRMLNKEEFDASEMSLSNYMIALGHGDRRFVAIPVFPSRVFRHSYIWINANAGIREPRDLIGKRVGIADYVSRHLKSNPRRYRRVIYKSNPQRRVGSWGRKANGNTSEPSISVIAKPVFR